MTGSSSRRLAVIVALQLTGILAGTQFGKIAPLVLWYQEEVGLSLVLIGWLTSMIGIFVALVALPAGLAIDIAGQRRSFVAASTVLVAGGLALAMLRDPAAILVARLVEGAGYLVIVIAIPAIMTAVSPPSWRGPALAIWGGFVPIGFALADFLSAAVLPAAGQQAFLLVAILGYALFAALSAFLLIGLPDHAGNGAPPAGQKAGVFATTLSFEVALVALAFGIYVVLSVGFFAFMPAYVASGRSAILLSAGVVALLVPIGNVLAGLLVRGGNARFAITLAMLGFGAAAIVAVPAFAGAVPLLATASVSLFAIAGGLTASVLFAVIPQIVRAGGSVSVAIGLVAQAGGIGTLVGPPIAGWIIERYGFSGFGWFLAATGIVGVLSLLPLLARRMAARP
jgi:MFS family permease